MKILNPEHIDWAETVSQAERDQFQIAYDKTTLAAFERLHDALCNLRKTTVVALPIWLRERLFEDV